MRPRLVEFFEGIVGTGFFVPDYAILHALAIVFCIGVALREAERTGQNPARVFRAGMITVAVALLSARLFTVLQHADYYSSQPWEAFLPWGAGSASSGAFVGGFVAALVAARWQQLSVGAFLDCSAPAVALAIALCRIGCFLNGCDYGTVSSLPWAMRFPPGSGPQVAHFEQGLIAAGDLSLPVHPTQLYESLYAAAIFVFLLHYRKRQRHGGELFALLFILYPLGRFLNEILRADPGRGSLFFLSIPQVLCVVALGSACCFLMMKRGRLKIEAATDLASAQSAYLNNRTEP